MQPTREECERHHQVHHTARRRVHHRGRIAQQVKRCAPRQFDSQFCGTAQRRVPIAIRGHQRQSVWSSVAIRGHQWQSVVISGHSWRHSIRVVLGANAGAISSSRHLVISSSRHHVITSSRHHVITSSRHHVITLSRYHAITLSRYHAPMMSMRSAVTSMYTWITSEGSCK